MILNIILKNKRVEQNLTQVQLAKMANMSERQYRRIELGQQSPTVDKAILIAQALQTKVEEIFPLPQRQLTGEEEPDSNQA